MRLYLSLDPQSGELCQASWYEVMQQLQQLQQLQHWDFEVLAFEQAQEMSERFKRHAKSKYAQEELERCGLICFSDKGAALSLSWQGKLSPLCLDYDQLSYRQRLLRGGRQKEAVARAVLQGVEDGALVVDATAGLGRESMILAHAGARVLAFERQLPIWVILYDALKRAQASRFFPFTLPRLMPLGTFADNNWEESPEVIYYDPMFPERESSAQVKKDMYIFQQVIGSDHDELEFLAQALKLASKRVVVKRPSYAPPLEGDGIVCSYHVDGGQCRFDCYQI